MRSLAAALLIWLTVIVTPHLTQVRIGISWNSLEQQNYRVGHLKWSTGMKLEYVGRNSYLICVHYRTEHAN